MGREYSISYRRARSNEVNIDGEWKDGVFTNGTVTNPNDDSYAEGEFRRSLVIKGEANRVVGFFYGLVGDRAWSTLAYTGQIANGLPDGQGYLFGLIHENVAKFQGIFCERVYRGRETAGSPTA